MSIKLIRKIGKLCLHITNRDKRPFTAAIILAAGKGERMQTAGITKQLLTLDGKPLVVHTLIAFEKSHCIDEIIVVGAEHELSLYKEFKRTYGISKLKFAVGGGSSRAVSAKHGFVSVSTEAKYVAIHDGARCLITPEDIDRVMREAYRHGAVIAAKKATDTVKRVDSRGFIEETLDRSVLMLAQTPQAFKKSVYEVALARAGSLDATITDDAMLVAAAGFTVKTIECLHENIKVTTPLDLPIAEKILSDRELAQAEVKA